MSADTESPAKPAHPPSEAGPALHLPPLLFSALAGTMAMMAYVAVIGPAARQLGLPEWVVGLSITAGGVFWMLLARWWGGISDRHGRKPVLLIGFGVFAAIYLMLAASVDLALRGQLGALALIVLLVGTRSLIGAVYAAVPPCTAALIADHTPPPERPACMAKLGTANALGMVAGPAAAGMLAAHDLSLALYGAAALPAVALLVIWFALPHSTSSATCAPDGAARPKPSVKLFDPRLRLASLTALIAMSSVAVAQVLVGFIAIDRLGLDAQAGARAAGLALATVGLALIASQQFVMRLKSVPLTRWVSTGTLIAGIGFASVALVHTQAQLLACYAVAAFGMGLVFPSFQAMAANAVHRHEQGAAAGTVSAAQGLGMVVAPLAGTLLYRIAPSLPYLLVSGLLFALALFVVLHRPLPLSSEPTSVREHP
ncbi:MFS transporter [Pseudothauera nasutitermitis]|uniref:MFS transporter n=1 Tax=Pseudothauera nasutitermitis TaxID=2565930 RepID=A0A4S4AWU4_9RHOO|nr:MFS transporter [Pseudothauera nasutitermitis]THF64523.1 MFS transporter [Pseudothauera nasutitermitis]